MAKSVAMCKRDIGSIIEDNAQYYYFVVQLETYIVNTINHFSCQSSAMRVILRLWRTIGTICRDMGYLV